MKRNFIFVSILLATFSINNVALQTIYQPCALTPQPPAFAVKVVPDPIIPGGTAKYTIAGSGKAGVPKGILSIQFGDQAGKLIGASKVEAAETVEALVPADLPVKFRNVLIITDDAKAIVGCAVADGTAGTSAPAKAKTDIPKAKDADIPKGTKGDPSKGDNAVKGGVTIYLPCALTPQPPAFVVKVVPDPITPGGTAKYTIAGSGKAGVPKGILSIQFGDQTGKLIGASKVEAAETVEALVPADLPVKFRNVLIITDDAKAIVGCAVADGTAGTSTPAKAKTDIPKAKDADIPKGTKGDPSKGDNAVKGGVTIYLPCALTPQPPAFVVKVVPDPITPGGTAKYTIAGSGKAGVPKGILSIQFGDQAGKLIGASKVEAAETVEALVPADLPVKFRNVLIITDDAKAIMGCAVADGTAGTSAPAKAKTDIPKAKNADIPKAKNDDIPKAKNDDIPKAKNDDIPKAKNDDIPKAKNDDIPKAKNDDIPKAKNDDIPKAKNADIPKAKNDDIPKAKNDDIPKAKNDDIPKAKNADIPKAKNADIPKAKNDDIPKAKNDDIPKAKNDDIPKAKNADIPKAKNADIPKGTKGDPAKGDNAAKGGVTIYLPCALTPQPPTLAVKVVPDPIIPGGKVTYILTGPGGAGVPKGALIIQFADQTGKLVAKIIEVAAAKEITTDAPVDLPAKFRNALIIMDDAKVIVGCAAADVTADAAKGTKGDPAKGDNTAKGGVTIYLPCALTPRPPALAVEVVPNPIIPGGKVTYILTGPGGAGVPKGALIILFADQTGKLVAKIIEVAAAKEITTDAPVDLPAKFRNALIIMDDAKVIVSCAVADGTAGTSTPAKAKTDIPKAKDADVPKAKDGAAKATSVAPADSTPAGAAKATSAAPADSTPAGGPKTSPTPGGAPSTTGSGNGAPKDDF